MAELEVVATEDDAVDVAVVDESVEEGSAVAEAQAQLAREREKEVTAELLLKEVARRRNFAIISHPDAGKTTLVGTHALLPWLT